jgi:hypothetical protein
LVAGPIIIENNPFIADYFQNQEASTQSFLISRACTNASTMEAARIVAIL